MGKIVGYQIKRLRNSAFMIRVVFDILLTFYIFAFSQLQSESQILIILYYIKVQLNSNGIL